MGQRMDVRGIQVLWEAGAIPPNPLGTYTKARGGVRKARANILARRVPGEAKQATGSTVTRRIHSRLRHSGPKQGARCPPFLSRRFPERVKSCSEVPAVAANTVLTTRRTTEGQ